MLQTAREDLEETLFFLRHADADGDGHAGLLMGCAQRVMQDLEQLVDGGPPAGVLAPDFPLNAMALTPRDLSTPLLQTAADALRIHLQSPPPQDGEFEAGLALARRLHRSLERLPAALERQTEAARSGARAPFGGRGRRLADEAPGDGACCVHRRDVTLEAWVAPVAEGAVGAYLGDHKYVRDRKGDVDAHQCLGIQSRYAVQILGIRRLDGHFDWYPHVTTQFERGDAVYYVGTHRAESGRQCEFEERLVLGIERRRVGFQTVELTSFTDGAPTGIPAHLHGCVIGAAEHRQSKRQGALYFRNTFANLAIHLIIRVSGEWIRFPGPAVELQEHDRIFMLCQIVGDSGRQSNPLLCNSSPIHVLLMPEEFARHVKKVNSQRAEELQVILPA